MLTYKTIGEKIIPGYLTKKAKDSAFIARASDILIRKAIKSNSRKYKHFYEPDILLNANKDNKAKYYKQCLRGKYNILDLL